MTASMEQMISRTRRIVGRLLHGPRIQAVAVERLTRLGSAYGGWEFVDLPELAGSTIVSCGLGEDASFDVEFAARYGARILIVDPTPRAISHFEQIAARVGQPARRPYVSTGSQPIDSYDLTRVSRDQLELLPVALADHVGQVRMYAPKDRAAVSHSIVNFQHAYATDTPYIEVACIDVRALVNHLGTNDVPLLKMDIEGAEIMVLPQLLGEGLRPNQILVEFDELNWPSRRARRNFDDVHGQLVRIGYQVVAWDRRSCVSYLREGH